jgi:hypothetical protein
MKKLLLIIPGVVLLAVLLQYGTLDPCGIVRAKIRQEAAREGGFGGFLASALPDAVINGLLEAQYGPLSPGRCIGLAFMGPLPQAPAGQPPQSTFVTPQPSLQEQQANEARARQEAAQHQARIEADRLAQLRQLTSQLFAFNTSADATLSKFPPTEQRYRTITQRMRAGLAREESIYGVGQAAVARGQLSIAINQGSIDANQIHINVQGVYRDFDFKSTQLLNSLAGEDQTCRGAHPATDTDPAPVGREAWNLACVQFFNIEGKFQKQVSALRDAFANIENVWNEENRTQQQIMQAASVAVR